MNQFCPVPPNLCPDPSNPIANYSSEAPDAVVYIGRRYSTDPPPLGGFWTASSCTGQVTSTISQEDADDRAAAASVTCLPYFEPQTNPNTDPDQPPTILTRIPTFSNEEQTCSVPCPDGGTFTNTIAAGTVVAFNQATANEQAASLCVNRAIAKQICVGDLVSDGACIGETFHQSVTVSTRARSIVVTTVSGALPDGITYTYDATSITFDGVATTGGQYDFTLQVSDPDGNSTQKAFTIYVREISPSTLPNGQRGNNYSQTLTLTHLFGEVIFAVTQGSLPSGLTLTAGVISGVPQASGSSTFTVSATDDRGTCSREYTLVVNPGVPWDHLVWSLVTHDVSGTGVATWIAPGAGAQDNRFSAFVSTQVSGGFDRGHLIIRADLVYAGPNFPARVATTISNNNKALAQPGTMSCQVQWLLNSIVQATANMPSQDFNGTYNLDFTATAGVITILINMDNVDPAGAQPSPMQMNIDGTIQNV